MDVITENSASMEVLEGKKLVVIGYGNQGRPQALNLRDSGLDVSVAVRAGGTSWKKAKEDGFDVVDVEEGVEIADIILMLIPDDVQKEVFEKKVNGRLKDGAAICFAHGFSVAFGGITSRQYDLLLVAPKGQGMGLRKLYLEGSGLPCLLAVENDYSGDAWEIAVAIASGLGCLRVGGYKTTFREETISDLFGEQAILCGGVPALIKMAFDILVERGYSPEVAYFECLHELKIIVDIFMMRGFSGMRDVISGTAAFGSLAFGEGVLGDSVNSSMKKLLERIESGRFAEEFLEDARNGFKKLEKLKEAERKLLIEKVGKRIRKRIYSDD